MASLYGVLTTDRGGKVERASRTGETFAKAEIAVETREGGEVIDYTYRLEVTQDGVALLRLPQRWRDAVATPEIEWEILGEW